MQRGKNRLRLAKVIVKNKMSRFLMVHCVLTNMQHATYTIFLMLNKVNKNLWRPNLYLLLLLSTTKLNTTNTTSTITTLRVQRDLIRGEDFIEAVRKPVVVEVCENVVNPVVLEQVLLYAYMQIATIIVLYEFLSCHKVGTVEILEIQNIHVKLMAYPNIFLPSVL